MSGSAIKVDQLGMKLPTCIEAGDVYIVWDGLDPIATTILSADGDRDF